MTRTVTLDTECLGLGNGMEGETRAACRVTTELHRDDCTIDWQALPARGIAAIGPSIRVDLDVQIVPRLLTCCACSCAKPPVGRPPRPPPRIPAPTAYRTMAA